MNGRSIAAAFVLSLLVGCTVGPNYHRPAIQTPEAYRAAQPAPAPPPSSLSDLKWFEIFKDEKLQDLVRTALAQNYDLRDAVARVDAARANFGITRSAQFPQVSASGAVNIDRLSRDGETPIPAALLPSQNRNWG